MKQEFTLLKVVYLFIWVLALSLFTANTPRAGVAADDCYGTWPGGLPAKLCYAPNTNLIRSSETLIGELSIAEEQEKR